MWIWLGDIKHFVWQKALCSWFRNALSCPALPAEERFLPIGDCAAVSVCSAAGYHTMFKSLPFDDYCVSAPWLGTG